MSTSSSECQVLVVGAGPTGLVLAAQLLARGIRTRIVDKSDGPAREGRAVSVRPLILVETGIRLSCIPWYCDLDRHLAVGAALVAGQRLSRQ